MKIQLRHKFEYIISVENLLWAWQEFVKGKGSRKDVQEFSFNLMDNILSLHYDLNNHTYKHGGYQAFNIYDPKPRNIHKASVRDRLVHHAVYRILYPFFDETFISDSFSCRVDKGTYKAIKRFTSFNFKVSRNNTKICWVLKCDIRKFFANINHDILMSILKKYIAEENIIWLLATIIESFPGSGNKVGLPLGNLTSQLFVNIYMNEFDQLIKHKLKVKHYIRYADDFVILSRDRKWLENLIPKMKYFLGDNLGLLIHPDKTYIKTVYSGINFLGWTNFPYYKILHPTTKKRMLRKIKENPTITSLNSYLGLLKHGNTYKLKKEMLSLCKII